MARSFAALSLVTLIATTSVAYADPRELIGRPAPELRARPLDSDEVIDLAQYRGRVVVITFYATWCGACRRMAPVLDAMQTANEARGLSVLAFSSEPRNRLREHARVEMRGFTRAQCTGRTSLRFHARALPTIVLVDRQGVVRAAYTGAAPEMVQRLRRDVDRLLAD